MAKNIITIELCAEDRERLDNLRAVLDKLTTPAVVEEKAAEPAPEAPTEEQLPEQLTIDDMVEPEKEPEPEAAPEPQPEPEQPKIERSDIQKKVVALSGAGKKDAVRGIVLAYGNTKVSDIPEDKLVEVWEKLTALGG